MTIATLDPLAIHPGPFRPTWESLDAYRAPAWFRDAKFGIWAHWGPQAVPRHGDWYARKMYQAGSDAYRHHCATYGHPSRVGYKDIIPLWKAEHWDPQRLMSLYRRAGARYFVSMAVHHDNFDLWDSPRRRWNSVAMGPRRDIVGGWRDAARQAGLRFGVSEHLAASYTWFQASHGADADGRLAGIPYDGADPAWHDLYHPPARPDDGRWLTADRSHHLAWFARIKDLVDRYGPDLLYSDSNVPFGEVGRSLIAHFYNRGCAGNGGMTEVVYNAKCMDYGTGENRTTGLVQDMERGVLAGIPAEPWQTDTSIGDWFYNSQWRYRPTSWIIHLLADIVARNGNLLLNIVQRPEGDLDPEVETILAELAAWMAINGEAIHGTRPWLVHGEGTGGVARTDQANDASAFGPGAAGAEGHFREELAFGPADVRYTTRDGAVYAIVLGWPAGGLTLRAMRLAGAAADGRVELLGHPGPLRFRAEADGALAIAVPDLPPDLRPGHSAWVFRLSGLRLTPRGSRDS